MNISSKDIRKGHTVIAITQDEGKYKAVCLSRKRGAVQVLWTKNADSNGEDWSSFAVKCGIDIKQQTKEPDEKTMVVAGFDSVGVIFYNLKIPVAKPDEMEQIIRLQTESRLPLAGEQIEISHRTGDVQNGQACVTVAASRKDNLQRFMQNVQSLKPEKIILDCEAITKTWSKLFATDERKAVVISIGDRTTKVCLVESGKLTNAATVDIGIMDFLQINQPKDETTIADRFVQDIRGTIELFGFSAPGDVPVYVLSSEDNQRAGQNNVSNQAGLIKDIAYRLLSSGIRAKVSDFCSPVSKNLLSSEDWASVYENRVPVGLGLIALDSDKELDLFAKLYKQGSEEKKGHWLYSLKTASIVTAVMAVITVSLFYFLDVAGLKYFDSLETKGKTSYESIVEKQKLMEFVAGYRPDIMELLNQISSAESNGIMLSGFEFKRGQPIKIKGTASDNDRLYKFQESLEGLKDIQSVVISSSSVDEKTRKVEFTMAFHYKNFTK